jgi:hypothetical protein
MTEAQRQFWEDLRDLARARRCARRVPLEVAADALALEQEIEARLAADANAEAVAAVAEERKPEERG